MASSPGIYLQTGFVDLRTSSSPLDEATPSPDGRASVPSDTGDRRPRTGIVLLNMGGPETLDDVGPFLSALFDDRELMELPMHRVLAPFLAKRRTPHVRELYREIGGGSPILRWTRLQGEEMCARLDRISPETAPHKAYVAFRYVHPTAEDALREMDRDGIERAIAFSQYPQWSCTTSGSSLNDLWRTMGRLGLARRFRWSLIDRWPTHPGFIEAMAARIREGLARFDESEREDVVLLFSAHSLPISVIAKGDTYPQEMGASVDRVMALLDIPNRYLLSYQSEVGPVTWLGPSTEKVITNFPKLGYRKMLVVPIAFTSDHIETLSEIDIEYRELAEKVGFERFERAEALNDHPRFLDGLAEMVAEHLASGEPCSTQYRFRCHGCTNPMCRTLPSAATIPSSVEGAQP